MKNKKIIASGYDHQICNYTKKEREVLNDRYSEFYVLCAIKRSLKKAVELARHNNILYSRNTIYAHKRMKLLH